MKTIPINTRRRGVLSCLVDDADFAKFGGLVWNVNDQNYVSRPFWLPQPDGSWRKVAVRLARLITNAPADLVVDHVDRNPLNNQRANLRVTTQQGNMLNRGVFRTNKVRIKGVTQLPGGTFRATIKRNGYQQHLGCFPTADAAARAYADATRTLGGCAR